MRTSKEHSSRTNVCSGNEPDRLLLPQTYGCFMLDGGGRATIASDMWMGRTWDIKDFLWCCALFHRAFSLIISGSSTVCSRSFERLRPASPSAYRATWSASSWRSAYHTRDANGLATGFPPAQEGEDAGMRA